LGQAVQQSAVIVAAVCFQCMVSCRSTFVGIAEKLPQPLKGVTLGFNKVLPVDVKIAPTPWTPQVQFQQ
jgi:hypothetical protein